MQQPLARSLRTTAVVAVVLGLLPFALDASVVWKVLGPVVAAVLLVHTAQQVWQQVFSTSPRHLNA
ncbi:hypothetical protein ACI79D_07510 [Geodermatophilus sp. SYSU D00708]